jgi:Ca2+:H+ antiporter
MLLVCGAAMIAGGDGRLERRSLLLQLTTILVAVALFCIPSLGALSGDPERHALYVRTLPVAALLLCAYLVVTTVNVRRGATSSAPAPPGTWRLRSAIIVLTAATAATAVVSEILVGSLQAFGRSLGLSQVFVAAVIVALAGNAAEQGGAVVVARRGNPGLGADIAVSSATQVAVFVCPLVALASGLLGHDLPLSFTPAELAVMGVGALVLLPIAARGRSSGRVGVALVACYALAIVAFGVAGGNR